jgi:transposase
VLPRCDTPAMSLHLAEVAQAVAPGAHGVLLMDRAGWHRAKDLVVPDNLTLVLLPARAPELNPVENIWQTVCSLLKRRWLVPHYAAHEGCAGWAGAEPHASGTSHAAG